MGHSTIKADSRFTRYLYEYTTKFYNLHAVPIRYGLDFKLSASTLLGTANVPF